MEERNVVGKRPIKTTCACRKDWKEISDSKALEKIFDSSSSRYHLPRNSKDYELRSIKKSQRESSSIEWFYSSSKIGILSLSRRHRDDVRWCNNCRLIKLNATKGRPTETSFVNWDIQLFPHSSFFAHSSMTEPFSSSIRRDMIPFNYTIS